MTPKPHPIESCHHCSGWMLPYLCVVIGTGFIVVGILGNSIIDRIINEQLNAKVDLRSPESFAYKVWENQTYDAPDPYVQRSFEVYVFQVSNPSEVLYHGDKPSMIEYGPYYFKYSLVQRNVSFFYDHTTDEEHISFKTQEWFEFDPSRSSCMSKPCTNRSADEDIFTTINLPMLTTLIKIQTLLGTTPSVEAIATAILDAVLGGNETSILFSSRSVRDLTFGYQDPFLTELCKLDPEGILGITDMVPGLGGHYNEPEYAGSLSERSGFNKMTTKGEKVGWLSQVYGSSIAQCCANPPCPPNEMIDAWGSVKASTVQGTDATMFGKRVRPHDTLTTWTTETNRTTLLAKPYLPNDEQNVKYNGVHLLRFRVDKKQLENVTLNHKNSVYYVYGPSGLVNITKCAEGAPIFLSKPHFLDVSGFMPDNPFEVTTLVNGLKPNREIHDTFIDIEPLTGSTFRGKQRLQAAIYVTPYAMGDLNLSSVVYNVTLFDKLQSALVPIAWFEKGGVVTKRITDEYHRTVDKAMVLKKVSPPFAISLGSVMIVVCLFIIIRRYVSKSKDSDDSDDHLNFMYTPVDAARDPLLRDE